MSSIIRKMLGEHVKIKKNSNFIEVGSNMFPLFEMCSCMDFCRYNGWFKQIRWSQRRSEVHPGGNHPGYSHHLFCLYPSFWSEKVLLKLISQKISVISVVAVTFFLTWLWSDISFVVLFGACIEGVVLRDKYNYFLF